ncbi:hypothetical protein T484DRAFT_1635289, partial [Baffinella frigidus]
DKIGAAHCVSCEAGTFSDGTTAACTTCPLHTDSAPGSIAAADCTCVPGYFGADGVACTACAPGSYQDARGADGCVPCGAGTYSDKSALSASQCSACPAYSTSGEGSTGVTSCTCLAGYTGSDGRACTVCKIGHYKAEMGNGSCVSCPAGTYSGAAGSSTCTMSAVGSFSATSCVCNGGFEPTAAGACSVCGAGTWCSEGIKHVCGASSSSTAQSSVETACICDAGFTGPDGGVCAACEAGTFKSTDGNTECGACEAGTYQDQRGHASCNDCDAGTYSPAFAAKSSEQCMACPADSDSPSGSVVQEACVCNAGFPGQNGGPCTACVAGTYKADTGPGVCTPCEAGKYSSSVGSPGEESCLRCPANSQSGVGSGDIDECACRSGYGVAEGAGFVGKVVPTP